MSSEIKLPLNRYTRPAMIGMLVMFFWSMLYCLHGVTSGPLGDSTGILLFGHTVGNISRYYDPFVLGAFATIVTFCWNKIPPVRPYRWVDFSNGKCFAIGLLAGPTFGFVSKFVLGQKFVVWNCDEYFMVCLATIQFLPFGIIGAIGTAVLFGSLLFDPNGSVPFVLFITLVYLGKWVNWWVVNFIRHGFKGARSALRSTRDMSVVQQS